MTRWATFWGALALAWPGLACKASKSAEAPDAKWQAELESRMKAFNERKQYPVLTPEVLEKIPDSEVEQALLDFVDCRIAQSDAPELVTLDALSPGFRAVYATSMLEAEVNNGGFNQFFWNSTGQYAADAVAGFDLMGAGAYARLTREAIKIRDADAARIRAFRARGTLEAFSQSYENNRLNALDDEFYKLGDAMSKARLKFIRARPKMFVGACIGK